MQRAMCIWRLLLVVGGIRSWFPAPHPYFPPCFQRMAVAVAAAAVSPPELGELGAVAVAVAVARGLPTLCFIDNLVFCLPTTL